MYREFVAAVLPCLGLRDTLGAWQTIVAHLADAPRRRKRHFLS